MKKIPTLYKRIFDNHEKVGIVAEFTEGLEGLELHKLIPTEKWDGSCCAVIDGKFYKRYDAKKGKPVPEGAIKCQEEADPVTGHLPCWVLVDKDNPADKWFIEAYNNYNLGETPRDGTYEAIGKHFNGNKYNMTIDLLVPHGKHIIDLPDPCYSIIEKYLKEHYIEGIVFWNETEPVCKIKRSDFGFEW